MLCAQRTATVKGAIPVLLRHAIHARSCSSSTFCLMEALTHPDRKWDANCGPRRNNGPQPQERRSRKATPDTNEYSNHSLMRCDAISVYFLQYTWRHPTFVIRSISGVWKFVHIILLQAKFSVPEYHAINPATLGGGGRRSIIVYF
jgi:hypothetical protein